MQIRLKASYYFIKHAVGIVYKSSPKWTFINAFMTLLRGFIPLLLLFVVKQLIDVASHYISSGSIDDYKQLYGIIALTGAFFLLNAITGSLNGLIRERQSHFLNDFIQDLIHQKTVHFSYSYFEDPHYQNIFYRAINDANFRPARIFYGILQLTQNLITLTVILTVLSAVHWAMIPVLLITSIPVIFFRWRHSGKIYNYKREHTEDERKMNYFNRLLTARDFAKELRLFGLQEHFKNNYESVKNELREKQWQLAINKTKSELIMQMLSTVVLLSIITFVLIQAIHGKISNGSMAMYFLALQRGYGTLQTMLNSLASLYEDNLFLNNFFEFQNIPTQKNKEKHYSFPNPIERGISIRDLSFKYPNSEKWVLQNLNLFIPQGKTIALVGKNGSGKTTLVKLLAGLYLPTKGEITADNTSWQQIPSEELAENISIIFQDFMLYNVSANDNIKYGNINLNTSPDNIEEAAKKAGIHTVFNQLTKGYDTTLGTLFRDSQMISRGEWQRTALARSFYNTSAQIIILDEPTSSLDAFTEAQLIDHFKEIAKDKTTIVVSHRLSTIKIADMIVVLDNKGIAEVGEPDTLLKKKGLFYEMIESLK